MLAVRQPHVVLQIAHYWMTSWIGHWEGGGCFVPLIDGYSWSMLKHCLQVTTKCEPNADTKTHQTDSLHEQNSTFRPTFFGLGSWDLSRSSQPVRPLSHKFSPWMRMILRGVALFLSRVDTGHGPFMAVPKGIRTVFVRNWFLFFASLFSQEKTDNSA